ncbi:hypothetical protein BSKO_02641 [Bryopsis sp. KO-2023]|nr:hypothetical protein BSKO_02641 [Bryopsis sp. KO-2023]
MGLELESVLEASLEEVAGPPSPSTILSADDQEDIDEMLLEAARDGDLDQVKVFVSRGANLESEAGSDAVLGAAWNGHSEVVEYLLLAGADSGPLNLLGTAAMNGSVVAVKTLLGAGLDKNAKDSDGETAKDTICTCPFNPCDEETENELHELLG